MRWFFVVALIVCFSFSCSFAQEGAISEQRISEEVVAPAPNAQGSASEDNPGENDTEEVSEEPQEPVEDSAMPEEENTDTEESNTIEQDQSS